MMPWRFAFVLCLIWTSGASALPATLTSTQIAICDAPLLPWSTSRIFLYDMALAMRDGETWSPRVPDEYSPSGPYLSHYNALIARLVTSAPAIYKYLSAAGIEFRHRHGFNRDLVTRPAPIPGFQHCQGIDIVMRLKTKLARDPEIVVNELFWETLHPFEQAATIVRFYLSEIQMKLQSNNKQGLHRLMQKMLSDSGVPIEPKDFATWGFDLKQIRELDSPYVSGN